MPLSILIRKDFSLNYYRDLILKLLKNEKISSCYIASGFFSDFTHHLPDEDLDISISEDMYDKKIFLYGNNNDDNQKKMSTLATKLKNKGLNVNNYMLSNHKNEKPEMFWHAKIVLFTDVNGPVFSIIGSSNFTSPSMYGDAQCPGIKYPPEFIQLEADTIYWLKDRTEIDDSIFTVFNRWGKGNYAPKIYFNDTHADNEFEKLLDDVYTFLLKFEWIPLDSENK